MFNISYKFSFILLLIVALLFVTFGINLLAMGPTSSWFVPVGIVCVIIGLVSLSFSSSFYALNEIENSRSPLSRRFSEFRTSVEDTITLMGTDPKSGRFKKLDVVFGDEVSKDKLPISLRDIKSGDLSIHTLIAPAEIEAVVAFIKAEKGTEIGEISGSFGVQYYVLNGSARIKTSENNGNRNRLLSSGDGMKIMPESRRSVEFLEDTDILVIYETSIQDIY